MNDDQIDDVFNAMPGGVEGFCKTWGYRQFASAIMEAAGRDDEQQRERFTFVQSMCRDAQEVGARYGWALHTIATLQIPQQDNMVAANMRKIAHDCLLGSLSPGKP